MKAKTKTTLIIILSITLLIIIIGFALYLVYNITAEKGEGEEFVIDVIDGDTFKMNTGDSIRLLCVNTPEKDEEGYERATKFLESLVLYKEVRLEQGETLNKTDKYQRTLAFVYVNNLGKQVFVNKLIIDSGFSEVYTYGDLEGECPQVMGV
ncbi:thermonuclease family protein [Candidatus Pacearchaeota archaeon]|nr:thermonuclease family protein [Candidatus Pacearchaeota archaeon]